MLINKITLNKFPLLMVTNAIHISHRVFYSFPTCVKSLSSNGGRLLIALLLALPLSIIAGEGTLLALKLPHHTYKKCWACLIATPYFTTSTNNGACVPDFFCIMKGKRWSNRFLSLFVGYLFVICRNCFL